MLKISPFAPKNFPQLTPIEGMSLCGVAAGLRYEGRVDVMMAYFEDGASVAGVFTKSKCASAPVDWCKQHLSHGVAKALLVNAGNANAFAGKHGVVAVDATADAIASHLGCKHHEIFLASTGVIGEPLNPEAMQQAVALAHENLKADDWENAAKAILTTDTFPKAIKEEIIIDGETITLQGIVKGSGMIAPDMATMLGYVFTDANISSEDLQSLLSSATEKSYNAITVDSDMSTSDTVMAFATCKTGKPLQPGTDGYDAFAKAFETINKALARLVVTDGEGISKLLEITVSGATSDASAKKIALSIGNSPLVKTAAAGEDANWGRVVMAVGKAGEPADRDQLEIKFGDLTLASNGERVENYSEEAASEIMKQSIIPIHVEMGLGNGNATILASDLTHDYISINGDYRS